MSLVLPLPRLSLSVPRRQGRTTIRIVVWVLVLFFVVVITALGGDPALALGVALTALTATVGDLSSVPVSER